MSRWWGATFADIRSRGKDALKDEIVGHLSAAFAYRALTRELQDSWRWTADELHTWVNAMPAGCDRWLVLLEYAPPLMTSRPDVVIVTQRHVLVIEIKSGVTAAAAAARNQALGYAADLYWFHPGTRSRVLVAAVVTSGNASRHAPVVVGDIDVIPAAASHIRSVDVPSVLHELSQDCTEADMLDHDLWLNASYSPRPSIVDAAVALVAANEDEGIDTALSDDTELERLTALLITEVLAASQTKQHRLLLVAGVPGAGKTLVGLRLAHDPTVVARLRELESQPLYLSGNGPLIQVLTEALARDLKQRHPEVTLAKARRRASVLVKLVHGFTREALNEQSPRLPRVAVFDEAQRVWDADQMRKKHKQLPRDSQITEPEVILRSLERLDWSVVVALIGEGQEINRGETGASLWMEAAGARRRSGTAWQVTFPPGLVQGPSWATANPALRLERSRRSIGASWISDWVEAVLTSRADDARLLAEQGSYPLRMTRDLGIARKWLREVGNRSRHGLVASARAGRLRAYGVEMDTGFQAGVDWRKWFLDRPPLLQASGTLEIAASEFKCQGLELDYVALCWSWDMVRRSGAWEFRHLQPRWLKWGAVAGDKRRFGINAYRVLLTRARSGLMIWVPEGVIDDPTRRPDEMDEVARFLARCGVVEETGDHL